MLLETNMFSQATSGPSQYSRLTPQFAWIDVVVLDAISRLDHFDLFKTAYGSQHF
jgi:hypothetical protein